MKFSFANLSKIAFSVFVLSVLPNLVGCNKSNSQTASKPTQSDDKPVIEFRRTACFGTCPIYSATVARSGKITFTGERFIDKIGTFEARVPEAEVQQLLAQIDEVKFFTRDSVFVTGATDFPSQILRVRNHGKYHSVRTEGEGPAEIELLMKQIDRTILTAVGAGKSNEER